MAGIPTRWLGVVVALHVATAACALSAKPSPDDRRIDMSHGGVRLETEISPALPLSVREGARIGLLHDDADDVDRFVRVILEQTVFSLKAANRNLTVVERRSIKPLLTELKFQSEGLVKDQDLARIGQFLGLDYVVVFDLLHGDLNDLYGLNNYIDTWEVLIPVKIIEVKSAEVKLNCLSTTRARVGRPMKATEVRALNREALTVGAREVGDCLLVSFGGAPTARRR